MRPLFFPLFRTGDVREAVEFMYYLYKEAIYFQMEVTKDFVCFIVFSNDASQRRSIIDTYEEITGEKAQ